MSETKKEQLSAFMDGELDDYQKSAVDQILKEPELMDTWSRYYLISDCLNQRLPEYLDRNLAGEISETLKDEPAIVAPRSFSRSFIKPVTGFAIAASVTALAILGIQQQQLGGPHELPQDVLVIATPEPVTDRGVRAPVRQASGQTSGQISGQRTEGRIRGTECQGQESGAGEQRARGAEQGAGDDNCQ